MLFDVAATVLAFVLALIICGSHYLSGLVLVQYRQLLLISACAVVVSFQLLDLYSNWLRCGRAHLGYCVVIAGTMSSVITLALGFLLGMLDLSRPVLLWWSGLQMLLIATYRLAGSTAYRHWFGNRKTIVVGGTIESALRVAAEFGAEHGLYSVQKCVAQDELKWPFSILNQAATVVLAEDVRQKEEVILHCFRNGKELLVVPNVRELASHSSDVRGIQDLLILAVRPHPLGPAESLLKRIVDILGALLLLTFTSPLAFLVLILMPLTSPGPIFFRQERMGRHRRKFFIVKFRTMVPNAEELTGPVMSIRRDPRVTRLGRILRATRLDELPQLWNVLRGEMSLVGPRPEREFFAHHYEKILPAYDLRHSVKPGLTGLAQIKATYGSSVERKLHFDLLYIYRHSLMLDLKILVQTIIVVLRGDQAIGAREATPLDLRISEASSFHSTTQMVDRTADTYNEPRQPLSGRLSN
jgi:exopolysaccharide biosynthesis polyprenyl glycosylphosphotransferase